MTYQASDVARGILGRREGKRLVAYQDDRGFWSIGRGHLMHPQGPECAGITITDAQCERMFEEDLEIAVEALDDCPVPLNQNEVDALACFTFQFGETKLKASALWRMLCYGDRRGAADQFLRWDHEGEKEIPSIEARRVEERALFLKAPW